MGPEAGKALSTERAQARVQSLEVHTNSRVEFRDVTAAVQKLVTESGVENGVCYVVTPHTSAAVLVQENDDAALQRDLDNFLGRLAPRDPHYLHNDGNCDAHLKASIIGSAKTLLIDKGRLVLGRWQGVFLCEFDGPRRRGLLVKIVSD
jgi:secondary thiamine-phosphate synthase enzyme